MRGEKSLGTFTHLLSAPAIEALAYTGLDYVIIDMEHSPIAAEHAAELVGVAAGAGIAPFVRVDAIERSPVLKMLDAGAAGLIVPGLETVDEARRLVGFAKFAPLGNRGYCPTRDGGWGMAECYSDGLTGYMERANRDTLLLPQCETAGCLEHIDEICALEGVDGIFIGPFDLSIALGIPGDFANERHINAVAQRAGRLPQARQARRHVLRHGRGRDGLLRAGLRLRHHVAWTSPCSPTPSGTSAERAQLIIRPAA